MQQRLQTAPFFLGERKRRILPQDCGEKMMLVDELLDRKEFSELWVLKWAELLQIRSSNQVSNAFCACRRFSASSHTTLCGPSMTAAAISLPR